MISVSGVRGIVGQSLTAEVALRWAEAFGHHCKPGPVVVGGDSRVSKVMMRAAAFAGLAGAGCRIIDVGVVPTPTIGLSVRHYHARGGIAITASHNPLEWNAFKFYGDDGLFLSEDDGKGLRELVESNRKFGVPAREVGSYKRDDGAVRRHIEAVLSIPFLKIAEIRKRKFRVGLDAVCGAGGDLLCSLLLELGCDIVGTHLEPTGIFPRSPEPLPENLKEVGASFKASKVDIGFVVDPDADRLAVILENGLPAGEELTVVAASDLVLRYSKGPVVANCSTTRALEDIAAKYGVAVTRTKVGEAHVARAMHDIGAVIGGEGNGGVMFPEIHAARDTAIGIAFILQALLEAGTTATAYFASLPHYTMVKERIAFDHPEQLRAALKSAQDRVSLGPVDRLDGLKWSLPDSWVQLRASNTEPILRVFAEAPSEAQARKLIASVRASFEKIS
jgi:phosphomannomutase